MEDLCLVSCSFHEGEGGVVFFFGHAGDGRSRYSGAGQRRLRITKMEMAETSVWIGRCARTKPTENVFVGDDAEEVFLCGRWDYCMGSVGKRGRGCPKQPESSKQQPKVNTYTPKFG